jgi:hypothetical protein
MCCNISCGLEMDSLETNVLLCSLDTSELKQIAQILSFNSALLRLGH